MLDTAFSSVSLLQALPSASYFVCPSFLCMLRYSSVKMKRRRYGAFHLASLRFIGDTDLFKHLHIAYGIVIT